ncbi:MAG TPA: phosphoglycerate kinase [Gammaproteobacteria bacterium]|nr:phosphoglycerate kinase [Gammaproteobacteria bacterium]|tara:strand:- start:5995 stop:7179 length:1185 start_codon:yes stop_codon:yes gene_type:complete
MAVTDFLSLDIKDKRVLIREDLNVPITDGRVSSDARLLAALPTIQHAVSGGAKVIVMSHLGRPQEGVPIGEQPEFSLLPVAERLQSLSGLSVEVVAEYLDGFVPGGADVTLLENVRINVGESQNDEKLSTRIAALCDIYVMDAFATAHRAQASTAGVIPFAPIACAGPLLKAELDALESALSEPARPMIALVGGSKVSTKLAVLESLGQKVDQLVVGGGIANTFLAATGVDVGKSLCETDMLDFAASLLGTVDIPLPTDVVVSNELNADAESRLCHVNDIQPDEMIVDIGPDTIEVLRRHIGVAGTILWNGPVGVFEIDRFGQGTEQITFAIASSSAFSVAGGGDTLAAIDKYGAKGGISYISTGGGAFLEFVEGKSLPAVTALTQRTKEANIE